MTDVPTEEMQILDLLATLRRKDVAAFGALMKRLGVDRWSQIDKSGYGEVRMYCSAKLAKSQPTRAEMLDTLKLESGDDQTPLAKTFNDMAAIIYATKPNDAT